MPRKRTNVSERLGRAEWIEAALGRLAQGGLDEVRVEVLAKELNVTKGSFYWHFRDRSDLLDQLLDSWRDGRLLSLSGQVGDNGEAPDVRLRRILDVYLDRANPRGMAIEMAIRDWARRDLIARKRVREIDAERLRLVTGLFAQLGYETNDASTRALAYYSFIFGQGLLAIPKSSLENGRNRASIAAMLIGK
ncbi:MAG: TetR/AcrR family transcriptional regulator [Bradyrhizobium sp.]|uniref:TetR/AcrR family transcriptional regulator n=1 Tax=Bradyrhizobium sp. TaxID=376 RepID=UPI001D2C5E99|nr:TetR/AcrR family transcriptional regulator [Bradyrhizobium sp.]MBV9561456.1 TetR/AcrR family transcriptional regulator [Bradyrhizobium sp.]